MPYRISSHCQCGERTTQISDAKVGPNQSFACSLAAWQAESLKGGYGHDGHDGPDLLPAREKFVAPNLALSAAPPFSHAQLSTLAAPELLISVESDYG